MSERTKHLDPQLLQARWVRDGVAPEEWVDQATSALDQGFDGTALRQLAGLVGQLNVTWETFQRERLLKWDSILVTRSVLSLSSLHAE
jgi:hypothetical protein